MFTFIMFLLGLFFRQNYNETELIQNILQGSTESHWVQDRLSNPNIISASTTGVGFYAYARAAKIGLINKKTASEWIRSGFDSMISCNANNDGWLYHFVDKTGKPCKDSEVSSMDTVLFYLGSERAAELLDDTKLLNYIRKCKGKISTAVMLDDDGYFYHGWKIDDGRRKMLHSKWRNYNEGILIYKYFNLPFKPVYTYYDLPLFVYYYPVAFYPDEQNWVDNLGLAIDYQLETTGRLGYTATDSPSGYSINSPYIISPLSIYCCREFFPDKCDLPLDRLNANPLLQAMTINKKWFSDDRILLDDGIAILILGNK